MKDSTLEATTATICAAKAAIAVVSAVSTVTMAARAPATTVATLATIVVINGSAHAIGSILTSSYSPGLMTGTLGWLPLGAGCNNTVHGLATRPNGDVAVGGYFTIVDGEVVPVGEDQLPHLEIAREIVRRLAHLYGGTLLVEPVALLGAGARVLGFNYDTGERYLSVPDFLPE